jgi:hypothetical protein
MKCPNCRPGVEAGVGVGVGVGGGGLGVGGGGGGGSGGGGGGGGLGGGVGSGPPGAPPAPIGPMGQVLGLPVSNGAGPGQGGQGEDLYTLEAEITELQRENARVESQVMRLRSDITAMENQLKHGEKVSCAVGAAADTRVPTPSVRSFTSLRP